ncbi:MAG: TolC family protein [Flavobacteriaceae bacterium]|nr:TolC family protein [Flavobacteriaceae bacterium]
MMKIQLFIFSRNVKIFVFYFFSFYAIAQNNTESILSYSDFLTIVKNEHPYAKQANIQPEKGKANLLQSRGAFDPKINTTIDQKNFQNTEYYNRINAGLKIPTWFGIELNGGFEQNEGIYLNPENTTTNNGLLYAGISMPIGQGLFIDKRRAELKKAKLFLQISAAEKQLLLNELTLEAGLTYWKWFKAHQTLRIYKEAYQLAKLRHDGVKMAVQYGDKPTINNTEAEIQVQNRLLDLQQAELNYLNTAAFLATYLWKNGNIPLELKENTIPSALDNLQTTIEEHQIQKIDSLLNFHPELKKSELKISQLHIDQKFKRNKLLPIIDLKYNPITENIGNQAINNFSINNYAWGLSFQMPLFLRKERGALKLASLKLEESNYLLDNKKELLKYKVIAAKNQWETAQKQVELYKKTIKNYTLLVQGEQKLFSSGESSLFLVNYRELNFIKTQLKFIELITKRQESELKIKYALGTL